MKHPVGGSGQMLVEVVVAIGVVVLLVTGLIVSTSVTLKASQYSKARNQAVTYAQEAVESARALRDSGWTAFAAYAGQSPTSWCLDNAGVWTPLSGSCPADPTSVYTRVVTFTWQDDPLQSNDERMLVDVVVSWADGNKTYTVPLWTYLTQWK